MQTPSTEAASVHAGRTTTVPRALLVLVMLSAVALSMVLLRSETARASNRVQRMHQVRSQLRQERWGLEMELARLRAPERIRQRAVELGLEVRPPVVDRAATGPPGAVD